MLVMLLLDHYITARFCPSLLADMFLALDKDMSGSLSKQELRDYADGTLTDIFIERGRNQLYPLKTKTTKITS